MLALRSRPAEGGSKPPHAALAEDRRGVVNMNVEGGSASREVGLLAAVLCEEMEVVWPSGVVLRGMASNRPHLHWLKTVVENVAGKGVT
jgi:hypothetical protein